MEMTMKVYNPVSKRFVTVDGQRYNKLIKQGYYVQDGQLVKKGKTKMVWQQVKVRSPILNSPIFNQVVLALEPNDLLSLYITNKDQPILNNQVTLDALSKKYKVAKVTNFVDFIKLYHLSLVDKHAWLYQLENRVDMPDQSYVNRLAKGKRQVTKKMRVIVIDWFAEIAKIFKVSDYVLPLAISLLDLYLSQHDIDKSKLQAFGCACMHLACIAWEEYPLELSDYVYITDGNYDSEEISDMIDQVYNAVHGVIIRPIVALYLETTKKKYFAFIS